MHMRSFIRRAVPAVLLLTSAGALADSPLPGADVPAREVVTRAPAATPKSDDQLQELTRAVESLETNVRRLQESVSERNVRQVEFLDQSTHPLWP
jgi:TolA-binding protein